MHTDPQPLIKTFERRDPRLGRVQVLDARSLAYMVERIPEELRRPLRSVVHERPAPILNQGNLGACTGFAGTGWMGSCPALMLDDVIGADMAVDDAEEYARGLYSQATTLDPFEGEWPPDDTGSSGLAICKALKARGLISSYRWASTLRGFVQLLQDGPVLLGMPWHEAFFEPTPEGRIDPVGWADSEVVGGHEVLVRGVTLDTDQPKDLERAVFLADNSWGESYGIDGRFTFGGRTYNLMRHDCDLKQPVA